METLIVLDKPKRWQLDLPGATIISARTYLTDLRYSQKPRTRVYNLCRSYKYQSLGYYVSLLAEARGHHPLPSVMTMQDLKSPTMVRFISDELDALIQKDLKTIQRPQFTLSIYFGRNFAKRYDKLAQKLFAQFQAPLLKVSFVRTDQHWALQTVHPISVGEIPEEHLSFIADVAKEYFSRRRPLQKFEKAASALDIGTERITRDDYGRLAEFDALFIRETTNVNHHTYRFARRAAAEGLVVIDDPASILKCTNKVYLAELLQRNGLATPPTLVISKKKDDRIMESLGLPCILKQPDSSFSQGVIKVETEAELTEGLSDMLDRSDLVIAQKFMPTEFDWRVGMLNREPLYVCKYFMARKHWQIYDRSKTGKTYSGKAEYYSVDDTPGQVIDAAVKAANLIGAGLYGVDLKEVDGKMYVIEVNDNPSIDAGVEDQILGDELYRRIIHELVRRIELKRGLRSA